MKRISIYLYTCLFLGLITTACKKTLLEDPKSTLTPVFFTTSQGFQAGLTAAYAGFRTIWGPDTYFELTVPGTDEFIAGNDGNNGLVKYNSNFNTADGTVATIWKNCYTYINTCNGLIGSVPAGIDATSAASMVGEAKFLRANYYFILVQFWGDVTLNKTFQSVPTTSATRAPIADVYAFIIQDLKDAIAVLPASPLTNGVQPGRATKAAAMHMLAKVYLTRAGSSAKQADDYKNAYTTAIDLITNVSPAGGLKLQQDFGKVFAEGNEANSEILWTVQHTSTLAYNGSATQNNSGPDNLLCHLFVPKYEVQPGMQRSTLYGRPYIRVVPTHWLTDTVFSERVNDQRYNKTFQTVWLCNNAASVPTWSNPLPTGAPAGAQPGAPKFTVGDTAIWMPGKAMTSAQIAGYRYQVIPPAKYSIALSPAMIKYFDTKRPDQNSPSSRPIIIYRLAETYLIAAEALFMDGRAGDAVPYINTIRERAAYPSGNVAAMDITADKLSLDFILDERSRELCGELVRWLDLARTGKLLERVKLHNTDGKANILLIFLLPFCFFKAQANGNASPETSPYNVKLYGAKGDGKSVDTQSINKAIEAAAAAGGGTVYFPAGNYLSGSIHLKSGISLFIDQGATIIAAPIEAASGYDEPEAKIDNNYQDFGHRHWHNSLIWGENLHDISILGPGTLWGKDLVRSNKGEDDKRPNKTISLYLCRNVIIRDISILHGGWFGILATGIDNFTVDNVKMDTNRDGMDIDCCRNVRISNCSINSPYDDGICLKSTYGLGFARATENVTITNCQVSGYDEGSFLAGTFTRNEKKYSDGNPTGRIKMGTESNGGFKNVTISNCVFDYCRGLALETVDGALLEDVTITNITMRDIVNAPIFVRLGARMRGPETAPVGALRRVIISNVVCYNADNKHGAIISGIPGHDIEDLRLSNIRIYYKGGGTKEQSAREVPALEKEYPEPYRFCTMPSYGFFIRNVKDLKVSDVEVSYITDDFRPPFILDHITGAEFQHIKAQKAAGSATFVLNEVKDFNIYNSRPVADTKLANANKKEL